jgi:hypothetical protein
VPLVNVYAKREDGKIVGSALMKLDGSYELVLPNAPGPFAFYAGYSFMRPAGEASTFHELEGGDEIEVDVILAEPQYFSVRAIDSKGDALAGVEVVFITSRNGTFNPNLQTYEDGRLEKPYAIPPESGTRVFLEKPGYATGWGTLFTDQSPGVIHPEEEIVLWSGAGFEGDIVDGEGEPLANVGLTLTVTSSEGQVWPMTATTDADGHSTIVDKAPADVVSIEIIGDEGVAGTWLSDGIRLDANAITELGPMTLTGG